MYQTELLIDKINNPGITHKRRMWFDNEEDFNRACVRLSVAHCPMTIDKEWLMIEVPNNFFLEIRLHRAGMTSFYWSRLTGRRVWEETVKLLAGAEHFFVQEELRPHKKLKLTGVMVEANDTPE